VHLTFPNHTIKVEMQREKHELLSYLRKELQNYDIDISIEVDETEMKRYAYTPREKFEKLKEKNPLIEELRNTFDLDV
jgi:DNA polymerase-3 subunit gamma/tau